MSNGLFNGYLHWIDGEGWHYVYCHWFHCTGCSASWMCDCLPEAA